MAERAAGRTYIARKSPPEVALLTTPTFLIVSVDVMLKVCVSWSVSFVTVVVARVTVAAARWLSPVMVVSVATTAVPSVP
jgi:hypothetical protein